VLPEAKQTLSSGGATLVFPIIYAAHRFADVGDMKSNRVVPTVSCCCRS